MTRSTGSAKEGERNRPRTKNKLERLFSAHLDSKKRARLPTIRLASPDEQAGENAERTANACNIDTR